MSMNASLTSDIYTSTQTHDKRTLYANLGMLPTVLPVPFVRHTEQIPFSNDSLTIGYTMGSVLVT